MPARGRLKPTALRKNLYGAAGFLIVLLAWKTLLTSESMVVPTMEETVGAARSLVLAGTIFRDIGDSLWRVMLGVGISLGISLVLWGLMLIRRETSWLIGGVFELLRPVPPIAWVPLAITIFGVGSPPAVAIVAVGSFIPLWLGVLQGMSEVKDHHVRAARSLGASPLGVIVFVVVPSMSPYVFHGLRLGVGLGWFCVVASEMMGASSGLGHGVMLFTQNLQLGETYCYILAIGLSGGLINKALKETEVRLHHWHFAESSIYG